MQAWEAIQQAVDYIEEHLREEISTGALAQRAGLSPFYFQRLFKRLVNRPVQEYIRLRRLSKAAEALKTEGGRILDIALDFSFSSHANFTRAFKEAYGMTPEEFRKGRPPLNTFIKPELSMNYTIMEEGVPLIAGSIVLEIQRKTLAAAQEYLGFETVVSTAGQIPAGESTGPDIPGQLWNRYHAEKDAIGPYLLPGIELGMSRPGDPERGSFLYFAGGLAENAPEGAQGGFVRRELPAGEYIVCGVEAESFEELVTTALDQAGRYLFGVWLPGHKLASQPFSAERYYRDNGDISYMEIWVLPVPAENS